MTLFNPIKVNKNKKSRVGRGIGAGQGKTAGRGTKGQKSRSGFNLPRRFQGGQSSLITRIPKKKGFNTGLVKDVTVNTDRLIAFKPGDVVSMKTLVAKGVLKSNKKSIKIVLGKKKISGLRFQGLKLSKTVLATIAKKTPAKTTKTKE